MKINVSCPSKIILSGEHTILYGQPAIVVACSSRQMKLELNFQPAELSSIQDFFREAYASGNSSEILEKVQRRFGTKIKLDSSIPIGSGMGSSAALSATLAQLFLLITKTDLPTKDSCNKLALELEKRMFPSASGIDTTVVTLGGLNVFDQGRHKKLHNFSVIKNLTIVNTGTPKETTGEVVAAVREFKESFPEKFSMICSELGEIAREWIKFFENYQHVDKLKEKTPEIIKKNQYLLNKLPVVSKSTKTLIKEIEKMGGAAKISGAGGISDNSGIILVYHQNTKKLNDFLNKKGLEFFPLKFSEAGISYFSL